MLICRFYLKFKFDLERFHSKEPRTMKISIKLKQMVSFMPNRFFGKLTKQGQEGGVESEAPKAQNFRRPSLSAVDK